MVFIMQIYTEFIIVIITFTRIQKVKQQNPTPQLQYIQTLQS